MNNDNTRGLLRIIFGKRRKEKRIDIINSDNYIEWLIRFSEKNPAWRDDTWVDNSADISKEDIKNVEKLSLLYEIISDYAKENGLRYETFDNEKYYILKINNLGFRIGIILGQEVCYYCQKEILKNKSFIDFDDIRLNKEYGVEMPIDYTKELGELESSMMELYNNNMSLDEFEETTKDVLKRMRSK